MIDSFLQFIRENNLCNKNSKVLLALSGGIDSMVMAYLFRLAGFNHAIAHCNFKLRGIDSDEDEKFVINYCKDNGLQLFSKSFETKIYAQQKGISIQMAARELRLNWFEKLVKNEKIDCYATAHHLDDQIETFFLNLLRGTGISGIHGILPKQNNLIHPMLFTGKLEIIDFAKKNHIAYRTDISNEKTDYRRNQIRHEVIPVLEKIQPGFKNILNRNISRFRQAENIYNHQVKSLTRGLMKQKGAEYYISIEKLSNLSFNEICLYETIKKFGFRYDDAVKIVDNLLSRPGKIFFSPTHRLLIDRSQLIIASLPQSQRSIFNISNGTQRIKEPLNLTINNIKEVSDYIISSDPGTAALDADKLNFPLVIRKWKKGDYFYPFGMKNKKLLSDFFIDQKIPLFQKEKIWLLVSGKDIVWVIGHRIDNRFKITDATSRIIEFRMINH
ncbi:MAG: tRNA lysidine(34) synthetase TilS [Bacteroidales bacterium]|nr:tRNA lysidine(34) synthetase TilS [Bacteroidales bacterium]